MGNKTQHRIEILADVKTQLTGMDKTISTFQKQLREGTTKIDMTKGLGKDLSKLLSRYAEQSSKIKQMLPGEGNLLDPNDIKDFQKAGNDITKVIREIQRVAGDLGTKELIDAKKLFPSAFDARVDDLLSNLKQIGSSFSTLASEEAKLTKVTNEVTNLTNEIQELKNAAQNLDALNQEAVSAKAEFDQAKTAVDNFKKSLLDAAKAKLDAKNIENISNKIAELEEKKKAFQDKGYTEKGGKARTKDDLGITDVQKTLKGLSGEERERQKTIIEELQSYNEVLASLREQRAEMEKIVELKKLANSDGEIDITDEKATKKLASAMGQGDNARDLLKAQKQAAEKATAAQTKAQIAGNASEIIPIKEAELQRKTQQVTELTAKIKALKASADFSSISAKVKELTGLDISKEMLESAKGIEKVTEAVSKIQSDEFEALQEELRALIPLTQDGKNGFEDFEREIDGANDSITRFTNTKEQIEQLQRQILDFFSINNSVQLFQRAVQHAIDTVKELDAVMTETAVVTDFTIGDMWEKLPQYSVQASALGASIRDLYSATTLYYQQGLQTNEAMGVGTETMKMARIANMEATDATTAMTAALRGFNMEVNEMNAQRVNDVYSELAAITAADTSQIATAMGKTASIAASANMEFETTSALLAQIIETTQEAPETAGTAMKTIIARFTEVKELFSEGMLTGEDEEGEEININKIDAALKSVGISLKDFLNGQKGIDDIFLELASKWNTLGLATQRYIATTAAGSRQQSRFIAMMSNYDRTMELVNAANNSAGASQEQFNKTLDSLDAKLQQLNNAWDEFIMGIANNEVIKFGVDALTLLLNTVNGLTSALSGEGGLSKSIVSLLAVTGTLMGGKGLFEKAFGVVDGIKATGPDGQIFNLNFNKKGEQAGAQWLAGLKRAIDSKKTGGGFGASLGSFLGEKVEGKRTYKRKMAEAELAEYNKKNLKDAALDIYSGSAMADTTKAQSIYGRLSAGDISLQQAQKELADLGVQTEIVDNQLLTVSETIKATKVDFTSLGMAATGAGMALSLLGGLFDKMGWEEGAEAVKKVGAALTTVGSIVMLLGPVFNKLGITVAKTGLYFGKAGAEALASGAAATLGWGPFIGIAVAVLAVVGLLVAAFIAIRNASPEYQLEQASEAAEKAGQAAEEAAEKYDQLAASLDSVSSKEAALDNLAAGTREWKEAVADLNNEVLDLIAAYPELAQYVDSQDGVLRFTDEDAVEGILNSYADAEINAQSAKAAAQIEVQKRQQDVDFSNLSQGAKIIDQGNPVLASAYLTGEPATVVGASIGAYLSGQSMQAYDQVDQKATEELAKAYASGDIDENDAELAYLAGDRAALDELRAFGQSLIASEAAIDAYSEAILNNAAIASDLSDEQKSELEGMIGPDGIQSLIDTEKEALGRKTSEDLREDYAEAMNYEIVDGKIYSGYGEDRKEVIVNDDEIKSQLAAINVQNKLTGAMKNLTGTIEDVSPEIANLFSGAEGKELTSSDIAVLQGYLNKVAYGEDGTAIKEGELYDIYTELGLEGIYGTFDNFIKQVTASVDLGNKRITEAQTKLESIGATTDFFNNLNSEQLSGIADNIYSVFLSSGKDVALGLTNQINGYMQSMSPEQAQKFAEGLNMIDWSNIDSVEELDKILIELGFDAELAGIDVESLENEIASAAKAAKKFNLDTLKEEIKSIDSLIDNLKNREDGDRTFSKEERDLMVQSDESLKDDFVMTGIDEFIYVGDSIQSLILALSANTAALLGQYGEQVAYDAEQSRKWQAIVDKGETWTSGSTEYEILRDIATGEKTADQFQQAGLFALMKEAGIEFNEEEIAGNNTLIADLIRASYEKYGTAAQRENYFQAETDYKEGSELKEYYDKDNIQMQQSLNKTNEAGKVYGQYATTEESEKIAAALRAQAIEWGVNQTVIEQFNKSLEDNNNILDDTTAAILTNAIADKKATKQLEKTAKEVAEVTGKYEDLNDVTTEDVQKIGEALGLEDLEEGSDNFNLVKDNLDLINEAMGGDIESMQELQDLMAQGLGLTVNADTGFVDMSAIYDETGKVEQAAIDAMNALIEAGAFEIETVEVERNGEYDVPIIENGMITGFEKKTYTAGQTYQVVKPVDAPQIAEATQKTGSGGGGGGGGGSEETWENPYDKLYNLTREINEELRERERIERRYEKLLEKRLATAEQLSELSFSELDQLELEAELQREFISGRQQQIADLLAENPDMEQYFTVSTDENGEQIIRIDWDAINAVTDTEEGERIEEVLGKVEDWSDDIEDANDTLNDIEDTVFEIKERGKDEYMDLEDQIKEALTQVYQGEIDKLSDINDSINDTNSRLLDAVQRSIDEQRQERENAKTEEELSDKRSRLAYLQQDTSGANALEILKLQEEIAQGEEDYTDSLIDQKISELQRQNDEAAAQREQQINIAQAQLDHYIETGAIWQEVYSLMTSGLNEKTGLIRGSRLEEVLQKAENFSGLSAIGKMEWLKDLETNIASALSYLRVGRQIEDLGITSGQISFTTKDGKTLTGTVDSSGNVTTSDGKVFDDVYQGSNGFYYSNKTEAEGTVKKPESPAPATPVVTKKTNPYGNASETTGLIYEGMTGTQVKSIQWALKEMGYDIGVEGIDGVYGWATKRAVTQFQTDFHREHPNERMSTPDGIVGPNTRNAFRIKQYKTGGLADFTGPAWLDGTKSRPEYILNADQTRAFFELVDVLSALKTNSSITTQNSGDNTYDIDINVESIGSDYDVEQLANTVKRLINDDARYRNNNIAGHTR